jgi:hypothetical protein
VISVKAALLSSEETGIPSPCPQTCIAAAIAVVSGGAASWQACSIGAAVAPAAAHAISHAANIDGAAATAHATIKVKRRATTPVSMARAPEIPARGQD